MIDYMSHKQDLRPLNARMSKEQISAMEKEVNYFASRLAGERKLSERIDLERKSDLRNKFDFWR